jgi:uncharacterized protein YqeY
MGIFDRVNEDVKSAMKEGRKDEVSIYRMVLSEIKNAAIAMNSRDDITDEICIASLVRGVKTRMGSIEEYRAAGREDLISRYLPEALSEEELAAMVDEAVAESGAAGPKDMGKVMKIIMPRTQGRVDGKTVQKMVMERLKS